MLLKLNQSKMPILSKIKEVISILNVDEISNERKNILQPLINFIQSKVDDKKEIQLNFICTHNSRRSHLSQIWAQTMAHHFNIKNVSCYSAGTEATALFPMIVETLKNTGFSITKKVEKSNPVYIIDYSENQKPIIGFSKTLDDDFNPKSEFAAIMTCTQADQGCPFVAGSEKRISVPFEDPKVFDNTPQQAEKYNERSLQIATEMYYVFSKIKV